jgi:hypothetical protein
MTIDEQIERALDEVVECIEEYEGEASPGLQGALSATLANIIARAGAEAREAEAEKRGVENFDGPGRW